MALIGIDLGTNKVVGALFDGNGNVGHKEISKIERASNSEVLAKLLGLINTLTAKSPDGVQAVGIAVDGFVTSEGKVTASHLFDDNLFPLKEELLKALNNTLKIEIASTHQCSIVGETWKGAAPGCKNAVYVSIDKHLGAGILVDGHILRGSMGTAGNIGWMTLSKRYNYEFSNNGFLDYYGSTEGVKRAAKFFYLKHTTDKDSGLKSTKYETSSMSDIIDSYDNADKNAIRTMDQTVCYWGMLISNLINVINPEVIVLGGGAFGPAYKLIARINEEVKKWVRADILVSVKVVQESLVGDSALYGAAHIAMK